MNVSAANSVDNKARCAEEPIHIPGSIQSHGVLVLLSDPELTVLVVSANIGTMLGIPVELTLGSPVSMILGTSGAERLERSLRPSDPALPNPLRFTLGGAAPIEFECVVHRSGVHIVLELEPFVELASLNRFDAFGHVRAPIERMEKAPDVATLVRDAAEAVRLISGFDRAMVYRFDEEWHGDVISESTSDRVPVTYLGLRFPASDIPEQARRLYLTSPLRLIADVDYVPVPLVPDSEPVSGGPVDLSRAILRSVSPIHLEYLQNIGVRATLTISLIIDGHLWGLIACHHMAPRRLDFVTRASCEFFGRMLSWQLGSRLMAGDVQRKLWASGLIGAYTQALSLVSDFSEGLLSQPQQLLELFAAQGLALRIDSKFRRSGRAPDEALATSIATALQPAAVDGVAVSHHLAALLPEFSADAATASGALLIMLSEDGGDYLLCLRGEVISSIDWAGDIRVPLTEANGKLRPRTSFALWQETLRGQSVRWSTQDVDSARRLRKRVLERLEAVEHLRAQERLRHVAHHDALTQLPNRVGFQESLAQLLAEAQRDGSLLAVLFVDLDHFKSVNDTLGHAAGDRILRAAGERMRGCVRHADVVTRLGGDEFVVISPNLSKADDADVVAGKILEAIGERFAFDEGRDIRLTASVGVAVYPADARETETLLQCADDAMYRAKEAGRNRFARFTRGVETA